MERKAVLLSSGEEGWIAISEVLPLSLVDWHVGFERLCIHEAILSGQWGWKKECLVSTDEDGNTVLWGGDASCVRPINHRFLNRAVSADAYRPECAGSAFIN
jgi:hypothetical protein